MNTEDVRVTKELAAAEAKFEAAAEKKAAQAAEMRRSIDEHIALMRHSAISGIKAAREEESRDYAAFQGKLQALADEEAKDLAAKRSRAKALATAHLAQMADKKRTAEAWQAVDVTDARKADSAAVGGPLDAYFNAEAAALRRDMEAKGGPRARQPVERLLRKLTTLSFS